jgi:hypothetical protein
MILEQARRAVLLGVLALAGTAAAQGTPSDTPGTTGTGTGTDTTQPTTTDDDTTRDPTMSDDTSAPVTTDTDIDVNVPAPPPPVVVNTDTDPTYVAPTPTTEYGTDETMLERYGIGVALGGGVEGFTDDTARTNTDDGVRGTCAC